MAKERYIFTVDVYRSTYSHRQVEVTVEAESEREAEQLAYQSSELDVDWNERDIQDSDTEVNPPILEAVEPLDDEDEKEEED